MDQRVLRATNRIPGCDRCQVREDQTLIGDAGYDPDPDPDPDPDFESDSDEDGNVPSRALQSTLIPVR